MVFNDSDDLQQVISTHFQGESLINTLKQNSHYKHKMHIKTHKKNKAD